MTRWLGALLLLIGLACSACGTGKDTSGTFGSDSKDQSVLLQIETTEWNGWDQDYEPNPVTQTIEVTEGEEFELSVLTGEAEFEVVDSDEDGVRLEGDGDLMPFVSNPDDQSTDFTITDDEPLDLMTPTLDAGTNVTISLA